MPERPLRRALHRYFGQGCALYSRGVTVDGDVFAIDQRLVFHLGFRIDQFGSARGGEFVAG